jgi:membrane protein DedA with SNARE-associated domain
MFDWIVRVIGTLGYAGVAGLTFLENLFPPIPSELVIPLAGFVAARGDLSLVLVIAAGSAGSLAGATVWYEVGRRVGERRLRDWISRHGRWLTLGPDDIDRAQQWFERRGRAAVFIGRLVPGVRTLVSLPAGFAGMPLASFLVFSAAGTVIWTTALAAAGLVLQAQYAVVGKYVNLATNILLAAFAALMAWRYLKGKGEREKGQGGRKTQM